jgi:hypothetical protein
VSSSAAIPAGHWPRVPALATTAVSYACIACGAGAVLVAGLLVAFAHSDALYVDQWVFLNELLAQGGIVDWHLLWQPHGPHRIPLGKAFYLADLFLFNGTNGFLLASIFAVQLAHLVLLAWALRNLLDLRGDAWRIAAGIAAVCLFSTRQGESFLFGASLPFVIPFFCATVAFVALACCRSALIRLPAALTISAGAAFVATMCLSNGLVLWAMLCVQAVVLRLPLRVAALLGSGFVLMTAWYLTGYATTPYDAAGPAALVTYVLHYFGNSWGSVSLRLGIALSVVAIPASVGLATWVVLRRWNEAGAVALVFVMMFLLGTGVLTAIARAQLGLGQAYSSRYQTPALLYWACLAALVVWLVQRRQPLMLALGGAFVAVVAASLPALASVAPDARAFNAQDRMAVAALRAEVADAKALAPLSDRLTATRLLQLADYLRERHLSVFARPAADDLGRSLARFYAVTPSSRCRGSIDATEAFAGPRYGGLRYSGWATDAASLDPARAVLLVSATGKIVGRAETGYPRPDVARAAGTAAAGRAGYVGYVPSDLYVPRVRPFAIIDGGRSACPLLPDYTFRLQAAPDVVASFGARNAIDGLPRDDTPPIASIDRITSKSTEAGIEVTLSGWAIDSRSRAAGSEIEVLVDGAAYPAQYGLPRPDVAAASGNRLQADSGFHAVVVLPAQASGLHRFAVRLVSRDRASYADSGAIEHDVQ